MRKNRKYVFIIIGVVIIVLTIICYRTIEYNLKRIQMDTLYTYFHKIQHLIIEKNYPVNMDSLKSFVYKERNTMSIYTKLSTLEKAVNAYHK